ncbi:histidine kinase [Olivibacter sp. SDN3]|uniref:sensor histidine kinase n=1 Tax=Olivibacter sp. SDN3 TaxID=2764720 RepID=UPI001650FE34|nr:sensor histidine kinase [Olivibacter sp. SDN3]QNL51209.1 histidine kinase [Olivibacter sp. SDN3]
MKKSHIIYHILIWIIITALLFLTSDQKTNITHNLFYIFYTGVNIFIFYLTYFFITPYFIGSKRYLPGIVYSVILLFVTSFTKLVIAVYNSDIVMRYGDNLEKTLSKEQYFTSALMITLFFMLLSYGFRLATNSYQIEQARKTLETEKLNAELAFLKSQINPHFLFNSLNNIYSLAYQKSDKAPEAILKLSEIMRYMLYESNDDKVSLEDEINYLENYIDLQKLRVKEHVYLELKINVDNYQHRVMPLLVISFLENVFKHGVATDKEHPIRITVEVQNSRLHFKAQNKKNKLNKDKTGGIGLTNLKRRLELGYPNKHTFNIQDNDDYYSSELFVYL